MNAIDQSLADALYEAFTWLRDDDDLAVAVLDGGGHRAFSAGWDLKAAAIDGDDVGMTPGGWGGFTELWDLHKPVIADGPAVAGGFSSRACSSADLVVAADHVEFWLTEVSLGILPSSGGLQWLPRRLGPSLGRRPDPDRTAAVGAGGPRPRPRPVMLCAACSDLRGHWLRWRPRSPRRRPRRCSSRRRSCATRRTCRSTSPSAPAKAETVSTRAGTVSQTVYRLSSVMYEDIGHCEPAPAASLERARRFINTVNHLHAREYLPDAATFQRVCLELGLPDPGLVDETDLQRVRSVREALRGLAATHNEGPESDGTEVLAEQARRSGLQVSFAADAAPILVGADGADGVLGTVLATIADAMHDGHWQRMKACRNERCRWVFYDHSRNRTGTWCSMRICGNRHKVRAHRARQAAAG